MVRKPGRFNLLLVHGDGSRILRLNLPRWILYGSVALPLLGIALLGAIFGDYLLLRKQRGEMTALQQQVVEQRGLIDTFHRRLAEVRGEMASWRGLHARIWAPLGPEAHTSWKGSGLGGGTEPAPQSAGGRATLAELDRVLASMNEEGQNLRALERFMARAGKMLAALPSRWPVRGSVNSEFGRRASPWTGAEEFHGGMDIGADLRVLVKAPAPGTIIFAGSNGDYGNTVTIDHGQDIQSLYGHLQKALVAPGQKVERGQAIALTGNTGKSSGPHLHYEIRVKGQPVNPRRFLWD